NINLPAGFLSRTGASRKEAGTLIRCGAFDGFEISRPELLWRLHSMTESRWSPGGEAALPLEQPRTEPKWEAVPPLPSYDLDTRLQIESDLLDFTVSAHPLYFFRRALKGIRVTRAKDLHACSGRKVRVVGWLVARKSVECPNGRFMNFLTLEDLSGLVEVTLFGEAYERFGHLLSTRGPFLVSGRVEEDSGHVTLNGNQIEVVRRERPVTVAGTPGAHFPEPSGNLIAYPVSLCCSVDYKDIPWV
ncbi:OB-fold nucleic acid binding domain-containing protein, partial [Acidobacteriota bacterium]